MLIGATNWLFSCTRLTACKHGVPQRALVMRYAAGNAYTASNSLGVRDPEMTMAELQWCMIKIRFPEAQRPIAVARACTMYQDTDGMQMVRWGNKLDMQRVRSSSPCEVLWCLSPL